jgi:glutathionylspermidine synthase
MVTTSPALAATDSLPPADHANVVRRAIFDCCKWDPQMHDTAVLAPFALVLNSETWATLKQQAEALAAETIALEHELTLRHDLHHALALPGSVVKALRGISQIPSGIARVIRFDFHPISDGWAISEANTDVPGGFIEASGFTRLMAEHHPGLSLAGDPAAALAEAVARAVAPGATVALVHATAYTDDRQVMIFLARHLRQHGLRTCPLSPADVQWKGGRASARACSPIDAILRFFPGEWLPNLRRTTDWRMYFTATQVPQCNPATALLTQSKRLPLVWEKLSASSKTWRGLLPETRDPRDAPWQRDESWIVKPALGRVGDGIGLRSVTPQKQWKSIARGARWFPRHWVAQRRFEAVPVETPLGPQYPCIGVYTIGGRAEGIYARIAPRPLIDHRARDIAVLVER